MCYRRYSTGGHLRARCGKANCRLKKAATILFRPKAGRASLRYAVTFTGIAAITRVK